MTAPTKEDPLAGFVQLSPSVYIQESRISTQGRPPKIIVLAFWMNAPPRALVKYVKEYRLLAPTARIIFLLSSTQDFTLSATTAAQEARVAPAVDAIRGFDGPDNPVFLHMFSNGGVCNGAHVLAEYKKTTGKPLCVSSMIFDSAPGKPTFTAAVRAFSFRLPRMWVVRLICQVLLYLTLVLFGLIRRVIRLPDDITQSRATVNDPGLLHGASKDTRRRCYIYSETDRLVDYKDVESHAFDAKMNGWSVFLERFQGTPHVGHMKADPERYWKIVADHLQMPE